MALGERINSCHPVSFDKFSRAGVRMEAGSIAQHFTEPKPTKKRNVK
jgi:hypothetical protein